MAETAATATQDAPRIHRPAWPNLPLELPLTVESLGRFLALAPLLAAAAPRGDGHPVLVLPGFLANDRTTFLLRRFLRQIGQPAYGWRLGRNIGPTTDVVEGITASVEKLTERHGRRLSIIGWSLGGIFARECARQFPDSVRQVITLGSPFGLIDPSQSRASENYRQFEHLHHELYRLREDPVPSREPLSVPSTAIYTRGDGIVAWQTCVQRTDPQSENIEVRGSHCGLGHNAGAVVAIADRLAQPEGSWAPFRPPVPLRLWYPRPVDG